MVRPVVRWLGELGRTAPGLVRSYLPGGPVGARARQGILANAGEASPSRWWAAVHAAWADYLGAVAGEPSAVDEAVLDYARRCAAAGAPVDPGALRDLLPSAGVEAARAVTAQVALLVAAGRALDDLLGRLDGAPGRPPGLRPSDLPAAAADLAALALAVPAAVPLSAVAAAMRAVHALAPDPPELDTPGDDANLLAHLLAGAVPAYLANAGVRLLLLRLPLPLVVGIRTGRSAATVRLRGGRVEIVNGIAPDAVAVLDGDVEPLLQLATGSFLRGVTQP